MNKDAELIATAIAGLESIGVSDVGEEGQRFSVNDLENGAADLSVLPLDGRSGYDVKISYNGGEHLVELIEEQLSKVIKDGNDTSQKGPTPDL